MGQRRAPTRPLSRAMSPIWSDPGTTLSGTGGLGRSHPGLEPPPLAVAALRRVDARDPPYLSPAGMAGFACMADMVYIPRRYAISDAAQQRTRQRQMNPTEIERAIRDLVAKQYDPVAFPYDLIAIHNASKVTVSKLKSGQTNGATQHGDVVWKNKLFFRAALSGADLGAVVETMAADPLLKKQKPRLILTTDGEQVYGRDLKTGDTINEQYCKLDEQVDFLLPLADYERREAVEEHPADIKAAKKPKKLYDAILAANTTWSSGHHTHELNLLMTRLLFCFYAEKTGIFDTPKIFTNTLTQYTQEDGADVASLLD